MGWTSGWATRKDLIDHLTSGGDVRKHCCVGNHLWMIIDNSTGRYILLCMLQKFGKDEGWAYKDMDESMGPCAETCPISYLDQVPDPCQGYSTEWRERVRARHARRNRKLEVGTRLGSHGSYTIVKALGNKGWEVNFIGAPYNMWMTKRQAAKLDIYTGELNGPTT